MNTEIQKFTKLKDDLRSLENKKIRLEEQYNTKKDDLKKLVLKIKNSGYDPNKLKDIIAEKEASLKSQINEFEKKLQETSEKLSAIEV